MHRGLVRILKSVGVILKCPVSTTGCLHLLWIYQGKPTSLLEQQSANDSSPGQLLPFTPLRGSVQLQRLNAPIAEHFNQLQSCIWYCPGFIINALLWVGAESLRSYPNAGKMAVGDT